MKIFDFKDNINKKDLKLIGSKLRNNELVVFPTETVYGVGANATNHEAVLKIFEAKRRQSDNPLIVHVKDHDMIDLICEEISEIERKLMDYFMPGPFTLVLKKKGNIIPNIVSANLDTIGVRIPSNKIAIEILREANIPVAAPSANISSRPSGTVIEDVIEDFGDSISYFVDGGCSNIGIESTVCQVIEGIPTILRPGKITDEDIKNLIGFVKIDNHVFTKAEGVVKSPGMKYKHYAPSSKCLLIYSQDLNLMINEIKMNCSKKTVIIGFNEHKELFDCLNFYNISPLNDLEQYSKNIFATLRKADLDNPDLIIIEGVANKGFGIAIMNRLIRAVDYNYIDIKKQ